MVSPQWRKNLFERMIEYPEEMRLPSDLEVEVGIPSWHVNRHGMECQNNLSLSYIPGIGRTCGEDVETSWAHTNYLAPSTCEMGPGACKETLNDHWNGWNFQKIVDFCKLTFFFLAFFDCTWHYYYLLAGILFLKYFKDAVAMRKKHSEAFEQFLSTFDEDTCTKWAKMVDEWIANRTKPNPYEEPAGHKFSC